MIVFPNAKINIGLQVLHKRPDGFHELATIFYPIPLQDGLEAIAHPTGETIIHQSGLTLDTAPEENICYKAWQLLRQDFPELPTVRVHLHKAIPSGAGLGGGSADGAFMLRLLNTKFRLGLADEQLATYALRLGSDCPFFILNSACHATGRGEILEPLELNLASYRLVLVNPGIHVPTGWAFGQLTPAAARVDLREAIKRPMAEWKEVIANDFEAAVFKAHPAIGAIREELYRQGAVYASMSGSGSTVYGFFEAGADPQLDFPPSYFVRQI